MEFSWHAEGRREAWEGRGQGSCPRPGPSSRLPQPCYTSAAQLRLCPILRPAGKASHTGLACVSSCAPLGPRPPSQSLALTCLGPAARLRRNGGGTTILLPSAKTVDLNQRTMPIPTHSGEMKAGGKGSPGMNRWAVRWLHMAALVACRTQ